LTVETVAAGRYRIERPLGHGGMASVYLARDSELDRPVALKILAEALGGDEQFRRRFLREARVAARLSHANVVQVYDAGEEAGRPFIVMEFVPGTTLAEMLSRGASLPVSTATWIAHQAALGLQNAHEAGLVHRDVKPQNLLVRDDGVVKIADFGIARAAELSRVTELGTVLGTAAYLSPEQARGDDVTASADIYSLGAVLYEMVTGRPPFEFATLAELAEKQRDGVVTPVRDLVPSVPEDVEALVMRCLAREPRFRPASAAEVARALEPRSASETNPTVVAETRPLPARISGRVPRRSAWLWIAAATVVAAIAAAIGLARVGGSSSSPPQRARPVAPKIAPVTQGATPADEARNLAAWLRSHSR
jgi:serine/threonine-protein kinase